MIRKLLFLLAFLVSLPVFGQKVLTNNGVGLTNNGVVLTVPNNPDDFAGLEFWFDGKDASTFSLNGNKVIQWDDKSGNGRHVSNAVDVTRPTWNAVTGRVTFTAANSTFLQSAAFASALSQPNTIFVVYKITGNLADSEIIFDGVTGVGRNVFWIHGGDFRIYGGATLIDGATNANDNIHVACFNGVSSEYWINGVSVLAGNVGADPLDGITLGTLNSFGMQFADAELMEVFGYNRVMTTSERQSLELYVTDKWGL